MSTPSDPLLTRSMGPFTIARTLNTDGVLRLVLESPGRAARQAPTSIGWEASGMSLVVLPLSLLQSIVTHAVRAGAVPPIVLQAYLDAAKMKWSGPVVSHSTSVAPNLADEPMRLHLVDLSAVEEQMVDRLTPPTAVYRTDGGTPRFDYDGAPDDVTSDDQRAQPAQPLDLPPMPLRISPRSFQRFRYWAPSWTLLGFFDPMPHGRPPQVITSSGRVPSVSMDVNAVSIVSDGWAARRWAAC